MVKSEKFGEPDYFVEENIEEVMMLFMDVEGIEDIDISEDRTLDIYCEFKNLAKVRDAILKMGYVVLKAQLVKVPKMTKKIGEAELEKLNGAIETLEDYDDVQEIWTDLDQE